MRNFPELPLHLHEDRRASHRTSAHWIEENRIELGKTSSRFRETVIAYRACIKECELTSMVDRRLSYKD